jgi:lantibiotic transport system permease protein
MLKRALYAEALKMKRTVALKMVILAPLAVVLLTLFMASQAPYTTLRRGNRVVDPWQMLSRLDFQFWGMLMLPMYVTLQSALTAGLDHAENHWKALFARPVPRWTAYVAKLIVVMAMVVASAAILVASVVAEGKLLNWLNPELGFGPAPVTLIAGRVGQMTALAFLFLTIQHWASLRWRSFSVAIGFGTVGMVTSFAMLMAAGPYGAWPQYFPWALPMLVVYRPRSVATATWLCCILGFLTSAAGCFDFCRREVS